MKKIVTISLIVMGISLITLFVLSRFYHQAGDIEIEKAKNNNEIVIIDFWANGCGPCKKLSPIMDEIQEEYPKIKVMKIDINGEDGLHSKYNIEYVPTVLIFYKGEEFARIIGFHEKREYIEYIEALQNSKETIMMKFNKDGEKRQQKPLQ